jgi:hypothetical protein
LRPSRAIVGALLAVASAPAAHAADATVSYDVTVSARGDELQVEATFPPGVGARFIVPPPAARFVSGLEVVAPAHVPPPALSGGWTVPACANGCRIRYRVALARAAADLDNVDFAGRQGASIVAPSSTWLLRPAAAASRPFRLRATTPAGLSLFTGLPPAPDARDGSVDSSVVVGRLEGDFDGPYAVLGHFNTERLAIGGAELTVAVATPALDADAPRIRRWVAAAARAVTAYYGRYPVARALIAVVEKGGGVFGKEMGGGGGASVLLEIAPGAALDAPASIWIATHEMVHLAVPNMDREHTWLTEGLATYVEPIGRAQAGEIPAGFVWRDSMNGMPNGLPAADDRGLDRTPTWGRIYWGGALFCLMGDLEILERTHGKQSLQTALRAAMAAGDDTTVARTPDEFFAAADRALGAPMLGPLYARWATNPVPVDLARLWRDLGVTESPAGAALDDHAPLAWARKLITTPRSP